MAKVHGRKRWAALGLVVGVVATWGGFGLVEAATTAPATVITCTKVKNGKTKTIDAGKVAKCTKKGKGITKNFVDSRYQTLLTYSGGGANFNGMALQDVNLTGRYLSYANFSGSNMSNAIFQDASTNLVDFSGANLFQADFTGATISFQPNFTGAYLLGADFGFAVVSAAVFTNANLAFANFGGATVFNNQVFNNTICPNGSNSNDHGGTCIGFGM